jgi:hypothetical protein
MRTACLPVEAGDEEGRHALSNAREPLMTVRWHASNVPTGHSMRSQAAQAKRHLLLEPRSLWGMARGRWRSSACSLRAPGVGAHVGPKHSSGVSSATGQAWPRLPWRELRTRALAPTVCPTARWYDLCCDRGRRPNTTTAAVVGLGAQRPVLGGASHAQPLPRLLRASHDERDGHLFPLKERGLYHSENIQRSRLSWRQGEMR